MKAAILAAALSCLVGNAAASQASTNNLAYASPHAERPEWAATFPRDGHRRLQTDCGAKSVSFKHNVASGDPFPDSVVIWTRVTPGSEQIGAGATYPVKYTVARDSGMSEVVASGTALTSSDVDYTVKVIVGGLDAATRYYYSFSACGGKTQSPVGKTKTAPAYGSSPDKVSFATVSCSKYDNGYFYAYKNIADKADDLDAVLHLGDLIYEYAPSGNLATVRPVQPAREILSLSDYRTRHGQYVTDPDFAYMRASLPMINIPDDHEVANDGWEDGAENHQPATEGDWQTRVAMAFRAYFEWQPLRQFESDDQRFYRTFEYGNLVQLNMIDTRYDHRGQQPAPLRTEAQYAQWKADSENRQIMSDEQMGWLINQLQTASQTWKVIGNQILFTDFVDVEGKHVYSASADQWVAYKKSQYALLEGIKDVDNVNIFTGDIHNSYIMEAFLKEDGSPYAAEFVITSVTSGNRADGYRAAGRSEDDIKNLRLSILNNQPLMVDADIDCHGYFVATYYAGEMNVKYHCVNNMLSTTDKGEHDTWNYKLCSGSAVVKASNESC